jgi:GT2 family glycosyltransferase
MEKIKMTGKVGIGVITYNRLDCFRDCIAGVPEADMIVVVNDGEPYPSSVYPSRIAKVIQHKTNHGVGRSKNDALRLLLEAGCSHIFLSEDDVKIVNPDLCKEYIKASERSGIRHFNFAYHGFENKSPDGTPTPPRKIINYKEGGSISLHRHLLGAFQYFGEDVLRTCGFMDPFYKNMLEHIDHTCRIIRHGFHPPYWWFADIADSFRSIQDLDPYHKQSTIRCNKGSYAIRSKVSDLYFAIKNGNVPPKMKDVGEREVERSLVMIKEKYAYQGK